MEKWKIQAVKREGFNGVWRAGRHWVSNTATEIDVLDDAELDDPKIDVDDPKVPGGKRKALNPVVLSRKSFQQVLDDPRLSKFRVGDDTAAQDVPALRAEVEDLNAQLAAAGGEIRRLQIALAGKLTANIPALAVEVGSLKADASPLAGEAAKAPPEAPAPPVPAPEAHQDDHNPRVHPKRRNR
jgi:hypothetical protein